MKINAPADYDMRHFKFVRQTAHPTIEVYEPFRLRWVFAVAVATLSLLALAI